MTALELPANTAELRTGEEVREHSANREFVVMSWFRGPSPLETLTEEGRLRKERVALKICDALEYLHGQGVVYHDLNPEKMVGTPDWNLGYAFVS